MDIDKVTDFLTSQGLDEEMAYNLACLADTLANIDPKNQMDHFSPSHFVYTSVDGQEQSVYLGPTYPYDTGEIK